MRESKTGHKNITYDDAARDRYRCEMRVGKISRTAGLDLHLAPAAPVVFPHTFTLCSGETLFCMMFCKFTLYLFFAMQLIL